jgi:RNA-directed DNA polymerase
VLQLETKTNSSDYEFGSKLFKLYKKQIAQSSKKVREVFTFGHIATAFANLRCLSDIIRNSIKREKNLKLPLYQNLTDPCFLFIAYSKLTSNKSVKINESSINNVTLASLISLSFTIYSKKYLPKPTKQVFIKKINEKTRPLGIASSQDKIVQQALKLVLSSRFERIFLDSSYGYRPKRSCHSALKHIYRHCRGVN